MFNFNATIFFRGSNVYVRIDKGFDAHCPLRNIQIESILHDPSIEPNKFSKLLSIFDNVSSEKVFRGKFVDCSIKIKLQIFIYTYYIMGVNLRM